MGNVRASFSDEELLRKFHELGDVQALNALFEKYSSIAFAYFSERVINRDDCDDLTQDVLLKINKKINRGEPISNFYAYFSTCISNMFRDYLRKKIKTSSRRILENNDDEQSQKSEVEQIEAKDNTLYISEGEFISIIEECLKIIPKIKDRDILRDYIYGYPLNEIAKRNNCNSNTAASLWWRKKRDLMKCILGKLQI